MADFRLPKLTLADLARSGHVTRWHSVRTQRDQTLAEHHYMVARISHTLAKGILKNVVDAEGLLQIMDYSLLHDTPELLTGDLPSPLKRHIEQLCGEGNPLDAIEKEIAPWLYEKKAAMQKSHPEYLLIIKLADILDALVFISAEGLGVHAEQVFSTLNDFFSEKLGEAEKRFPEYDWKIAAVVYSELLEKRENSKLAFELSHSPGR